MKKLLGVLPNVLILLGAIIFIAMIAIRMTTGQFVIMGFRLESIWNFAMSLLAFAVAISLVQIKNK